MKFQIFSGLSLLLWKRFFVTCIHTQNTFNFCYNLFYSVYFCHFIIFRGTLRRVRLVLGVIFGVEIRKSTCTIFWCVCEEGVDTNTSLRGFLFNEECSLLFNMKLHQQQHSHFILGSDLNVPRQFTQAQKKYYF